MMQIEPLYNSNFYLLSEGTVQLTVVASSCGNHFAELLIIANKNR